MLVSPNGLVQYAITAVSGAAMLARGVCGTCTDDDIKAAVDDM
jgi:cytochrome c5